MAFDTEDDSKGNPAIFNFYDGETHNTFFTAEEAEKFICTLEGKVDIWACNLQYDISNLFYTRPKLCRMNYAGSRLISAQIEETQVYFKDTLNHWKISVYEMGKRVGLPKLDHGESFINVEYCRRDTEIVYNFVKIMRDKYHSIGARLKSTIGATALDHFSRHSEYVKPLENIFSVRELEFMREGMHGGRTEAYFNKPIEGMIRCYDFNSLYPSVLSQFNYPVLSERHFTDEPDFDNEGICHAVVESPRDLWCPYLPCRRDGVLLFALGHIEGSWSYFELREAQKIGYRIKKVIKALEFTGGTYNPFKKWIDGQYAERLKAQKIGDDLQSDSHKLIMNNLFGKYAQGNEKTALLPITKKRLEKHSGVILENKYILQNYLGRWPEHTNFIWSIYCLAYARHKLYQGIQRIPLKTHKFLYCDTDSIFIWGKKKVFDESKELGGLKLEGEFKEAYFKGLKNYRLTYTDDWFEKIKAKNPEAKQTIYKVRGVPRKFAELFFENGFAEYRKPYRLREALRKNSGKKKIVPILPNYWESITKVNRKIYDKRKVLKNGDTEPHRIEIEQ